MSSERSTSPAPTTQAGRSKAVALMASGTLVSRILGFIRTALLAVAIGSTTTVADVFEKSNTIPNIVFMLLAGGIFNVILVPQLIRASKAADRGSAYTSKLLTLTVVVLAIFTLILTSASSFIISALSSGWSDPMKALGTTFALWCMPQVFFYGLYSVMGQVLNAHGRFGAFMWAPVANNVLQIGTICAFIVTFGAFHGAPQTQLAEWSTAQTVVLAGGATFGIVLQAVVLFWPLRRLGLRLRPDFAWRGIGLKRVGRMALWTLAAMAVGNLTSLYYGKIVSAATAARQNSPDSAAIAGEYALNTSQLITVLPHSIFALSLATVLFNELSNAFAERRGHEVADLLSRGLRTTAVPIMFFTVGFIVLAGPLGRLFGGTSPTAQDAGASIALLIVLTALGLPGKSYGFFLMRVFYAQEDTRTPMLLQVFYAVVGLVPAIIVANILPPEYMAPAMATIYAFANNAMAIAGHFVVKRRQGDYDSGKVIDAYIRIGWYAIFAGLFGAAVLWALGGYDRGYAWQGYVSAIVSLVAAGSVMGLVYVFSLKYARIPELEDFLGPVARRLPGPKARRPKH